MFIMKNILTPIVCLISSLSVSLAQSDSSAPLVEEQLPAVPTYEQFQAAFPSAIKSGETGKVGHNAEIQVQEGQVFLNGSDTSKLMESYGNLPSQYQGAIVALDEAYVITFNFDAIGYVKDDEKGDLDADELLEAFTQGEEEGNKQRVAAGLDTLTTVGWSFEPKYNETTNNLEWALLLKSGDGTETVNHNIKLLGRKGVTDATLICDPSQLTSLRPMLDQTLGGFAYTSGNKYSEFQEGDKISEYGLKALMVGGGILAVSKFGKLWKLIAGGVIAIGLFIKSKFSGKKATE